MRRRRRQAQVFSISFLDCICCGFGGVLLLFVLVAGKQRNAQEQQLAMIEEVLGQYDNDIQIKEENIEVLARTSILDRDKLSDFQDENTTKRGELTELELELALLLKTESTLEDELRILLAEKEAIPTVEERPPLPIPNPQRRQYLTGFKLEGEHFLILVRASGSMVADSIEEAIEIQAKSDDEKRESAKWQRVVRSVQWIIASLPEQSSFQVYLFAEDTVPLLDTYTRTWFARDNNEDVQLALEALSEVVPQGGANLERAFGMLRSMGTVPDSVTLLTDGLPTQSDSFASGDVVTDLDRVRFFNAAAKLAPADIPINTILYPLIGDPASPFLFWQLADRTKGALVSPAPSWPDT